MLVPAPNRYAVHKLIVASRRRIDDDGTTKSAKDRLQATILMDAMIALRHGDDLADAYMEAWDREPGWREAIGESMASYDDRTRSRFVEALAQGVTNIGDDPAIYGL